MPQYEELRNLESKLKFVDNVNPPNIVSWIGASLLGSLNDEIGLFMLKSKSLDDDMVIPD